MTTSAPCSRSRFWAVLWVVLGLAAALLVCTMPSHTGSSSITERSSIKAPVTVRNAEILIAPATTGSPHAYDWTEQHATPRTTTGIRDDRQSSGSPRVIAAPKQAGVAAEGGEGFFARRLAEMRANPDRGSVGGGTPRTNIAQNKQFNDAIKAAERQLGRTLSKDERSAVHREISGQDYGYHDIVDEVLGMFGGGG